MLLTQWLTGLSGRILSSRKRRISVACATELDERQTSGWRSHWEESGVDQALSNANSVGQVDGQHANRRSACRRAAHKSSAVPAKVLLPGIVSRVKQSHDLTSARVDSRQVRPLVQIAEVACQSQVVRRAEPTVLFGNNV